MTKNTIYEVVRSGECTGCGSCETVCPMHCISFVRDAEGFDIPDLCNENCIGCGKCLSHCHIACDTTGAPPLSTKAALSKNGRQRGKSSSGGLSAVIVEAVIERNGCAYGAAFTEGGAVRHTRVKSTESAELLQGSKYVQSRTAGVLADVKADVLSGQEVAFFGTPCQVAGLKCYLGRDYPNLLCVDLVCHGVPSPGFWERHIGSICGGEISDPKRISFRSKPYYEKNDYALRFPRGKRIVRRDSEQDVYYRAFLHGLSFRECCYDCRYARSERVGDITLGDCASSSLIPDFFPEKSLSIVLINSLKGANFIRSVEHKTEMCEIDYSEEIKRNHQLSAPFPRPAERSVFYERIMDGSIAKNESSFSMRNCKHAAKYIAKRLVPYRLRMRVRKVLSGAVNGR